VRRFRLHPDELLAFRDGAVGAVPLTVGVAPWGVVTGVAMVSAGFTSAQAVGMSILVFAGSAQLAVLPLFIAKAPLWVMLATGLLVNLRYFIYSAVLAPHFARLSRPWRVLLSYITVDGMFAMFAGRYRPGDGLAHKHWWYLGGSSLMWVIWQLASLIGIFGGALIPRDWSLEFAATLALIALLMPLLFDRAVVSGAAVAGVVSLAGTRLPMNLGVLLAVIAGVSVGLLVTRMVPAGAVASGPKGADGR
jgi:predicted branched-subunit amino acid permease